MFRQLVIALLLVVLSACGEGIADPVEASPFGGSRLISTEFGSPASIGECAVASDCHRTLSRICETCADGGESCVHWSCVQGRCRTATCE